MQWLEGTSRATRRSKVINHYNYLDMYLSLHAVDYKMYQLYIIIPFQLHVIAKSTCSHDIIIIIIVDGECMMNYHSS